MKRITLATFALLLLVATALAQNPTGRLIGTVSDPSGVVPGATVVIRDNNTGKERTVVGSDDGTFGVPQLEAGVYSVRISAPGHKTFTANEVKIDVGREYSMNPTLEVGDINETITVTAGADVINATNGEISNTVSPRQIQELPLNGRDPLNLIQLQAGVASNGQTNTSINGQRPSLTNITRDGINVQDNFIRESASDFSPQRQTVDQIAEFTVTTSNAGADQGYGASQIQQVTPRGQSDFHGAVYEYNRNDYFGANNFFNNATGVERPRLNRNQFGGRLGGPMVLPRFGEGGPAVIRNKAFFFVNYEGLRLPVGSVRTRTILTPAARQGVFTYTRADNGQIQTVNLLDPRFGTGITAIDPVIQARILSQLPAQGNASGGDSRNTTGFRFNQAADQNRNQVTSRLDFDVSSRTSFNFVLSFSRENNLRPQTDTVGGSGSNLTAAGYGARPVFSGTLDSDFYVGAYRWTPTANFTNEVRGGYFKYNSLIVRNDTPPAFIITVPSNFFNTPEVGAEDQGRTVKTWNMQDNAQYQWGNHSLRFGGVGQFFRVSSVAGFSTLPTYGLGTDLTRQITTAQFTDPTLFPGGVPTNQRGTANALLALYGGLITSGSQTFNARRGEGFDPGAPQENVLAYENVGLYFADQWRVTPRLTLNLGVRYDLFTPIRDVNGSLLEIVVPSGSTTIEALRNPNGTFNFVGGNAGGNKLFKTDWNNFAPVLSFAYAPQFKNKFMNTLFPGEGRTVIRGGYSIAYVNDEYLKGSISATSNQGLSTSSSVNFQTAQSFAALPPIPVPNLGVPRTFAQNNTSSFGFAYLVNPDIKVPFSQQYNFGIQREIGWQTALEVRYVGGKSDNLTNIVDYNQIDIFNNGFFADFQRARQNLLLINQRRQQIINSGLTGAALTAALAPFPVSAAFNAAIPGSQTLTTFNNLGTGFGSTIPGVLNLGAITNALLNNTPGLLAQTYIQNGLTGTVRFQPNPNIGSTFLLDNNSRYNYNSLQVELRRRFADGLYFQANYTFSKTLADASGLSQLRFEPRLDNNNPDVEYARADYDQTHRFNFNGIYELPFGKGKRFFKDASGWADRLLGGWQLASIVEVGSGNPITITDARGVLNLAFFSTRNTPFTNLNREQLKDLFGLFERDGVFYYINPDVLQITRTATGTISRAALGSIDPLTGQEQTFPGQVFFLTPGGAIGNTPRAIGTAPMYFNVDASLIKNIRIRENFRLQLRAEAFNLFNRANFDVNRLTQDISSSNFGQIADTFSPRVVQLAVRIEF